MSNFLDGVSAQDRLADLQRAMASLADLQDLGRGANPLSDGLRWLANEFYQHFLPDLPLPYVYPTPDGGVSLEWSLKAQDVSVEIDLSTHCAHWHVLNLVTDATEEHTLDLSQDSGWEWLLEHLGRIKT